MRYEFPLQWLPTQPRTKNPQPARFGNHNTFRAGLKVENELQKLNAKNIIISSNLQQRAKGDGFYANQRIEDSGIVIYFDLKGQGKAMACDKWQKPEHNLWALYLSLQAIRGLERWGGSEFLDGLFTGFKALPSPDSINLPNNVNYFEGINNFEELRKRFRELAKEFHPDTNNGERLNFDNLMNQYNKLKQKFKEENNG